MAWDDTKQYQGSCRGFMIETGYCTLNGSGTVEVSTFLDRIVSVQLTFRDAGTGPLYCDGVITGGAVTVTSSAGGTDSADTVHYTFMGYR